MQRPAENWQARSIPTREGDTRKVRSLSPVRLSSVGRAGGGEEMASPFYLRLSSNGQRQKPRVTAAPSPSPAASSDTHRRGGSRQDRRGCRPLALPRTSALQAAASDPQRRCVIQSDIRRSFSYKASRCNFLGCMNSSFCYQMTR